MLIATGEKFPDAVSGPSFGPRIDAPLFTVPSTCIPSEVLAGIDALGATTVTLLGGEAILSVEVADLVTCSAS